MRSLLIILNLALTVAACGLTYNTLRPAPVEPVPIDSLESQDPEVDASSDSEGTAFAVPKISSELSDKIWVNNLFHPDRQFEEIVETDIKIEDDAQASEHFELISIAQVHRRSCASLRVITEQKKTTRRRSTSRSRRNKKKAGPKDKDQKVYLLDDPVGKTGYKLTEIGIDFVTLSKKEQEITLRLDKGDEGSEKRREQFAKLEAVKEKKQAAEKRRAKVKQKAKTKTKGGNDKRSAQAAEAAAKRASRSAPPPPPPPPPAVRENLPSPPVRAQNSDAKERRRQLRNQYLERVREGSGTGR